MKKSVTKKNKPNVDSNHGVSSWMRMDHSRVVLEIDRRMFKYSWSPDHFLKTMRKRNVVGRVFLGYTYKSQSKEGIAVDEENGVVLGYIVYMLSKKQTQIIRLATAPDAIRRGVGRLLVGELIKKLNGPQSKRDKIVVDVIDEDLRAQLFFQSMGFVAHQLSDVETYRFEYFRN
jgi:ribosomal protein S18 acetylase RimI-like enzyme